MSQLTTIDPWIANRNLPKISNATPIAILYYRLFSPIIFSRYNILPSFFNLTNVRGTVLSESLEHYISAEIYKGFYYNRDLDTSTIIKEYGSIEAILHQSRFIACLTIQIPHLYRAEYQYGSHVYNSLLAQTNTILKELKSLLFREEDILIVDMVEVDTFVLFLSPPRDNNTQLLDHIESMVHRARRQIEDKIFSLFYPYTKQYSKPAIGYEIGRAHV